MITRKMAKQNLIAQNDFDDRKSIQDDLNKSLKLNQQLMDEQTQNENEFRLLLESNHKLKTEMISMENTIEVLKLECKAHEQLLSQYQNELPQFETICAEKIKLDHQVQKLTDQISRMEQIEGENDIEREKLKLANQNLLTTVEEKENTIKRMKLNLNNTYIPNLQDDGNKELENIRSELRFKNAELKVLRKKRKALDTKSDLQKQSQILPHKKPNEELNELYVKYNKLIKDSEINLKTLESNSHDLKIKIKKLELNCDTIRKSYDDLSIINYENENEKQELMLTMREMEKILLQEEAIIEKTCDINDTRPGKDNTALFKNFKRNSILIIGDECIRGLSMELHNKLNVNLDICCHTYANAPVESLIQTAQQMALSQRPATIILITRSVSSKDAKKYVDGIMNLYTTLQENSIKLICSNVMYKEYSTPQDGMSNNTIFKHNTRLHNSCQYRNDIDIMNISSICSKTNTKQFKSIIANYIGAHFSNQGAIAASTGCAFFQRSQT